MPRRKKNFPESSLKSNANMKTRQAAQVGCLLVVLLAASAAAALVKPPSLSQSAPSAAGQPQADASDASKPGKSESGFGCRKKASHARSSLVWFAARSAN